MGGVCHVTVHVGELSFCPIELDFTLFTLWASLHIPVRLSLSIATGIQIQTSVLCVLHALALPVVKFCPAKNACYTV